MKTNGSPFRGARVTYVPDVVLSDSLSVPFGIAQNNPDGFLVGTPAAVPTKGTTAGLHTIQDVAFQIGQGFMLQVSPTMRSAKKGTQNLIADPLILGPQDYLMAHYEDE